MEQNRTITLELNKFEYHLLKYSIMVILNKDSKFNERFYKDLSQLNEQLNRTEKNGMV